MVGAVTTPGRIVSVTRAFMMSGRMGEARLHLDHLFVNLAGQPLLILRRHRIRSERRRLPSASSADAPKARCSVSSLLAAAIGAATVRERHQLPVAPYSSRNATVQSTRVARLSGR